MAHAQTIPVRRTASKWPEPHRGTTASGRQMRPGLETNAVLDRCFAAQKGIPKSQAARVIERIAAASPLPMGKLRAELIPDSSWKRAGKTLGPQASQTVARLEHILSFAEHVWGNEADAIEWLMNPHMELRGATPFSTLKTEAGGRAVEWILAALEYGFPV